MAENDEENWKDEDFLSFGDNADEEDTGDDKEEETTLDFNPNDLPPWMTEYTNFRHVSPLVALHNEIVGFCNLMSPMPKVSD